MTNNVYERLKAGEKAIDLSIESWERRINGKQGYLCALCVKYNDSCFLCPYKEHSTGCGTGSPYDHYSGIMLFNRKPHGKENALFWAKRVLAGLKLTKKRMIEEGEY